MAYAADNAGPSQQPAREDSLGTQLQIASGLVDRLEGLCGRLTAVADKLDGPQPQPPTQAGRIEGKSSPCLVGSLTHHARRLDDLQSNIREQINRIESALG